jgi:hypothetical protein
MLWQQNSMGCFVQVKLIQVCCFRSAFWLWQPNMDESFNRYCIIQNAVIIIIQLVLYIQNAVIIRSK